MPKYYLNIRSKDGLIIDPDGIDRPDLDQVRAEAVAGAREILAAQLIAGEPLDGQQIEICSEAGELLDVIRFSDMIIVPPQR